MTNEPQAQPPAAPELKPCPFCGVVPVANSYYMNQGDKWGGVVCGNCGVQGPEVRTGYAPWEHWKWAAVEAWNTRTNLPRAAADEALNGNERGVLNVLAGSYHRERHGGDMMICQRWPCYILVQGIRQRATASTQTSARCGDLGMDTAFPLSETLRLLVEWAQHLHVSHECDCTGWEQRSFLIEAAQRYCNEIKCVFPASTKADSATPVAQPAEEPGTR